jgi:ribosomal protein S6--L-glutamate ligase
LVLEVNSSPGLEGIEEATGIDVAGAVIEHIANAALKQHTSNTNLTDS